MKPAVLKYNILLVCFFIYGCDNKKNEIPFPANEFETSQAISKPLIFNESRKINWITPSPDSVSLPTAKKYDFSKIPSKAFDIGGFKPVASPVEIKKIDWNNLPDSVFNLDQLPDSALQVKTFILPKPKRIKTSFPELKEKASSGLYEFGLAQGLPGVKATSMIQDEEGMLWLIADGQLYHHNGEYLEQFFLHNSPYLSRIMQDRSGIIWASSYSNVICRLDSKLGLQSLISTSARNLFNLIQDNTGHIWLGTFASGIYIIDWNKKTFKNYQRFSEFTVKNSIWDLLQDEKNRIWLVGGSGAIICDIKNKKAKFLNKAAGLSRDFAVCITEDHHTGSMWLSMPGDSAINIVSPEAGTICYIGKKQGISKSIFKVLKDDHENYWALADSMVYVLDRTLGYIKKIIVNGKQLNNDIGCILQVKRGQVLIGTNDAGIIISDANGLMPEYLDESRGLSGRAVWGLAEDNRNQIWVGGNVSDAKTNSGFLNMIDSTAKIVFDFTKVVDSSFFRISVMCRDIKGKIYAGYDEKGFVIIDHDKKTVTHIGKSQGLLTPLVSSIMADSRGLVWIGTTKGIFLFDPVSGSIKHLEVSDELNNSNVYCLYEDSDKQIWVGTQESASYVIDSALSFIKHFSTGRGESGDRIFCFSEDKKNRVWVSTENGVAVIDKAKKEFTILSVPDGLNDSATYVLQNTDNRMYVGTKNGLTVFTEYEIFSADGSKNAKWKASSFDKNNGFFYQDFHSLSLRTKKGKLWFPIDYKVIAVIDEPILEDSIISTPYITGINLFDQPQDFSDYRFVTAGPRKEDTIWTENKDTFYLKDQWPPASNQQSKNSISLDSTVGSFHNPVNLQVPHNQNYFSFRFNNTGITGREKTMYRYILEGIDRNWSAASEKTISENYRNLSPGKYTFKVRCKGINGVWSDPVELSFTIIPPWWKTWWAYLLYTLFFIGIVLGLVKYRSRWLKKENQRLEQMVAQRTNELSQSLKELKVTQTQLIQSEKMASLGELTAGIAHEIQNPLNFVNNFSEVNKELLVEMKDEMSKGNLANANVIADDVIENQEKINHHGKRADAIVKGMLQHSRSSTGQKEPTDINALADEYLRLTYHGLRAKDKTFNAKLETDFDNNIGKINVIPQDIGRVLVNLINNAFYAASLPSPENIGTGKGGFSDSENNKTPTVWLSTKKLRDKVLISVKDNGPGISPNILDKIFQPFFTTKPTGQGTGLGLSLSYDIVKAHGGEIKVESKEARPDDPVGRGEGSEFIIALPINT